MTDPSFPERRRRKDISHSPSLTLRFSHVAREGVCVTSGSWHRDRHGALRHDGGGGGMGGMASPGVNNSFLSLRGRLIFIFSLFRVLSLSFPICFGVLVVPLVSSPCVQSFICFAVLSLLSRTPGMRPNMCGW